MVGIAVLGGGIYTKVAHVPALIENRANVLAVYSRSTKSATSVLDTFKAKDTDGNYPTGHIEIYSDETPEQSLDVLLARSDIQACIITLPILVQPDVVRRCLKAGKHVLCEKPIAKDVKTGRALLHDYETLYAPQGLVFSIAEQFRYDRAFGRAREIVAAGEIGKLSQIHARVWGNMAPGNEYFETAWRKQPEYQGGFVLDGGVHNIALLRRISGLDILETRGMAVQLSPHLPPVDTVNAALKFSGGAVGSVNFTFTSTKRVVEFVFLGSKGALTVTAASTLSEQMKLIIEMAPGAGDSREEVVEGKSMYEEIKAFINAAASGVPDQAGSPREALIDVAVIESLCSGGGLVRPFED
ncbi:hypothetical protein FQN57_002840 [Myotisia sp. PD_48]|nr:hypothetical protein FQN57_002840 [Myotisia sp. PD_48]